MRISDIYSVFLNVRLAISKPQWKQTKKFKKKGEDVSSTAVKEPKDRRGRVQRSPNALHTATAAPTREGKQPPAPPGRPQGTAASTPPPAGPNRHKRARAEAAPAPQGMLHAPARRARNPAPWQTYATTACRPRTRSKLFITPHPPTHGRAASDWSVLLLLLASKEACAGPRLFGTRRRQRRWPLTAAVMAAAGLALRGALAPGAAAVAAASVRCRGGLWSRLPPLPAAPCRSAAHFAFQPDPAPSAYGESGAGPGSTSPSLCCRVRPAAAFSGRPPPARSG